MNFKYNIYQKNYTFYTSAINYLKSTGSTDAVECNWCQKCNYYICRWIIYYTNYTKNALALHLLTITLIDEYKTKCKKCNLI